MSSQQGQGSGGQHIHRQGLSSAVELYQHPGESRSVGTLGHTLQKPKTRPVRLSERNWAPSVQLGKPNRVCT